MLTLILLTWWLPHINSITKSWKFYLLNYHQTSLLRSNSYFSLIRTATIFSLLVKQHSLSCIHLLIIPVLHTATKMIFAKHILILLIPVLPLSMAYHCFKDENLKPYTEHKSPQIVATVSIQHYLALLSLELSPLLYFLLLTKLFLPLPSVWKAIILTKLMPTRIPSYLISNFTYWRKFSVIFQTNRTSDCIIS